jgi:hypothetical protein
LAALPGVAQGQIWLEQFGTLGFDWSRSVVPDGSGCVYVSGCTSSNVGGPSAGGFDAWFARYDSDGNRLWIRQFGTAGDEFLFSAAPDSSGGLYLIGSSTGSLGGPNAGNPDAWIARHDAAGQQLWVRQLGTSGSDYGYEVAPDAFGGVYVAGTSDGGLGGPNAGLNDTWFARYDSAGNQLWIRSLGTNALDQVSSVAADGSGGVYIGGTTGGSLAGTNAGSFDSWLARYDGAGNQLWIRQFGTSAFDVIDSAAMDGSGGVYIGGATGGSLAGTNAGIFYDAFLARYDGGGNQVWIRQFGSANTDGGGQVAADGFGGVYISGWTFGDLVGTNAGLFDAWLGQFDAAGNQQWIQQFGSSGSEYVFDVKSDGGGRVYIIGETDGSLGAPNQGETDAWFARYAGVAPPPPVVYCTTSTSTSGCNASISASAHPSSAFSTPCLLGVAGVEAQKQGLIFYGVNNTGFSPLPWYSSGSTSLLCVKPPTQRTGIQNSGGVAGSCTGGFSLDWNAFHAANPNALGAPFAVGSKVYVQGWFRDPPALKSTNLSNAVELRVLP